jgi:hypothetical protein
VGTALLATYEIVSGGGGGGDTVAIIEPFDSGVPPPVGFQDGQIKVLNVNTGGFEAGDLVWYKDANA